jgi:hypothetical protein
VRKQAYQRLARFRVGFFGSAGCLGRTMRARSPQGQRNSTGLVRIHSTGMAGGASGKGPSPSVK